MKGKTMQNKQNLGTENILWDLSVFYKRPDDPQIDTDLVAFQKDCKVFYEMYKGKLQTKLASALEDYITLIKLESKLIYYLHLLIAADVNNEVVKTKFAEVEKISATVGGEYLTFFELEVITLSEEDLDNQVNKSDTLSHHIPWLSDVRKDKPYVLPEDVEVVLTQMSPFGPSAWSQYYEEVEADLRFSFKGKEKTLTEMLSILSGSQDANERAQVQKIINDGLKENLLKYSTQTLNMVVSAKQVLDNKRGYTHPMESRNRYNKISDAVVEALHIAVKEKAAPLARDYYRLKSAHLNKRPLLWSDRNAPMPFAGNTIIPYEEGFDIVVKAYESFSSTLADIIRNAAAKKHIDAGVRGGKQGGAFNASTVLPDGTPISFTFLNYQGLPRDIMTLAHELGHGVHGILAGKAQGILMQSTPTAYAETASVFGEMTTFKSLKQVLAKKGDTEALLALVMNKLDDAMNTTVRQISFSEFEQNVHNAGRRFSPDEMNAAWMDVTKAFYGEDGDVFSYQDVDALWSYVSHFHRPFYVYAYATGDLLTNALYAKQKKLGERFEPLYLDLLRDGGTKDAVELLKPFDLNPTDPQFWHDGIDISIKALLEEAVELSKKLGVTVSK